MWWTSCWKWWIFHLNWCIFAEHALNVALVLKIAMKMSFLFHVSIENAEMMENCPWKTMILHWNVADYLQFEAMTALMRLNVRSRCEFCITKWWNVHYKWWCFCWFKNEWMFCLFVLLPKIPVLFFTYCAVDYSCYAMGLYVIQRGGANLMVSNRSNHIV